MNPSGPSVRVSSTRNRLDFQQKMEQSDSSSSSEEEDSNSGNESDNNNAVSAGGQEPNEAEFREQCASAISWDNAHHLGWSNLVDPSKKPNIEEATFDFSTWDTIYTIMVEHHHQF